MTGFARVDFAGPGGASLGMKWLGIDSIGVEYDEAAVATARANGMKRWLADIRSPEVRGFPWPRIWLYQASPSCQSFSLGGKGEGRKHLDSMFLALRLVADGATPEDALRSVADDALDGRTELSLEPMLVIREHRPSLICFEQVPPVLPLWEAYAEILRSWGYSVWCGNLTSETFGVPQTRKRAILMARDAEQTALLGPVGPPPATHSRYYPRDKTRLDEGVLPWVSMAQALGRAPSVPGRDKRLVANDQLPRSTRRHQGEPAPTITAGHDSGNRVWAPSTPNGGDASWVDERPSPTIVGSFRPEIVAAPGWRKAGDGPRQSQSGSVAVTVTEAAVLQSFPRDFIWCGGKSKQYEQVGNAWPPLFAIAVIAALIGKPLSQGDPRLG